VIPHRGCPSLLDVTLPFVATIGRSDWRTWPSIPPPRMRALFNREEEETELHSGEKAPATPRPGLAALGEVSRVLSIASPGFRGREIDPKIGCKEGTLGTTEDLAT